MLCEDCGTTFDAKRPGHRFCSAECRGRAHRDRQKGLRELVDRLLGSAEQARLAERRQAAKLPPLRRSPALDAQAAAEALRRMGQPESRFQVLARGSRADELPRRAVADASHYGLAVALTSSGEPLLVVVVGTKSTAGASSGEGAGRAE